MDKVKVAREVTTVAKPDESAREEMVGDQFDARPIYPDELKAKPSAFRVVINYFRDIFSPLVEGVRSAWSAIEHALGGSHNAANALRNINQGINTPKSIHELAINTHESLKTQAEENKVSITENSVAAVVKADDVALADADEVSFSHYLRVYKADQAKDVATVCPQNFKEGATRHAQKLFDNEVKRCAEFADKPKEYFVAVDDQIKIQASAALLNKKVPHPVPLKFGEMREVARHSVDQFGNFLAWREWKKSGNLPEDGKIDLVAAKEYADSYISKYAKPEFLKNQQVQNELKDAYELFAYFDKNRTDLDVAMVLFSLDEVRKITAQTETVQNLPPPAPPPPRLRANSPPAPPPPRISPNAPPAAPPPRVGASPVPVASAAHLAAEALGLKETDIAQIGSLVMPDIKSSIREKIIYDALPFLDRLQDGRFNPVLAEDAMSMVQYWNNAANNQETLKQLQSLPSFARLDKLLDMKTIMAQMPQKT